MTAKEQLKARFFGMHIGCGISIPRYSEFSVKLRGVSSPVNESGFMLHCTRDSRHALMAPIGECKLVLRPFPDITDEEAIECASVIGICDTEIKVSRHDRYLDVCSQNTSAEMRFYFCDKYSTIFTFDGCDGQEASRCIDYLRSRNFCLPFHGFDPVAEGWAILEEKNPGK